LRQLAKPLFVERIARLPRVGTDSRELDLPDAFSYRRFVSCAQQSVESPTKALL
jgi:hypothetical protein